LYFCCRLFFCPQKKKTPHRGRSLSSGWLVSLSIPCVVPYRHFVFIRTLDLTCFTFHVFPCSILYYGVVDTVKGLTQFDSEWTRRVNWTKLWFAFVHVDGKGTHFSFFLSFFFRCR
jgi:hypothetical protein